jgi:hypothetical protein
MLLEDPFLLKNEENDDIDGEYEPRYQVCVHQVPLGRLMKKYY